MTKTEYVKRVDEICASYKATVTKNAQHFEAIQHRAGATGQIAAVAGAYRGSASLIDRLVKQVRAVPPPSGDQARIDAWLAATEQQADDQRTLADALGHPPLASTALTTLQDRLKIDAGEAAEAIADYGFQTCGPPQLTPG